VIIGSEASSQWGQRMVMVTIVMKHYVRLAGFSNWNSSTDPGCNFSSRPFAFLAPIARFSCSFIRYALGLLGEASSVAILRILLLDTKFNAVRSGCDLLGEQVLRGSHRHGLISVLKHGFHLVSLANRVFFASCLPVQRFKTQMRVLFESSVLRDLFKPYICKISTMLVRNIVDII
jgi:hypothetical protein